MKGGSVKSGDVALIFCGFDFDSFATLDDGGSLIQDLHLID